MATAEINDLVIKIRSELDTRGFEKAEKTAQRLTKRIETKGIEGISDKTLKSNLSKLEAPLKAAQAQFQNFQTTLKNLQGMTMSLGFAFLFTGMMLQRFSMNIIKSSLKTFTTIAYGAEGAGGALGVLNVHFELLKFAVGEALSTLLEAFMPAIIEVIVNIVDWISQHKELAAKLVALAALLGTGGMVLGAIALFVTGIFGAANNLLYFLNILGGGTPKIQTFSNALRGLGKLVGTALLIHVGFKIFGRKYTPDMGAVLGDAFEAALGGYLVGGLKGAAIGLSVSLIFDIASVLSGINTLDLMTLTWKNSLVWAGIAWDTILTNIRSIINAMRVLTKEYTFKEMLADNEKLWADWSDRSKTAIMDYQKEYANAENKTWIQTTAERFAGKGYTSADLGDWGAQELSPEISRLVTSLMKLNPEVNSVQEAQKVFDEMIKSYKSSTVPFQQYVDAVTQQTQATDESVRQQQEVKNVEEQTETQLTTMNETLATSNERINGFVNTLTQAGLDAQRALTIATGAVMDKTNNWYSGAMNLQKQLGIPTTGPHTYNGINYASGEVGENIMRSMFGDYTAGVGQAVAGRLSNTAIASQYSGAASGMTYVDRKTIVNGQTNVYDSTSNTTAGRLT